MDEGRLQKAERLWQELQDNELGGYSGINRPFWIKTYLDAERRVAIEEAARCIESQNGQVPSVRRYLAGEIRKLGDSTEGGDAADVPKEFHVSSAFRQLTKPTHAVAVEGKMNDIRAGLQALADQVSKTWLATDYPEDMQDDRAQFRHAHLHAAKALGTIAALIDHQDHGRLGDEEAISLRNELPKLLADIIRCTAKMAETAPVMPVRLARAYTERAGQLAERWGHGQA